MFEKRDKTAESHPKDSSPSLEAVMALQKMLEDGLLDEINAGPSLEVRPSMDRAERTQPVDVVQATPMSVPDFLRYLAGRFGFTLGRKKPIGGRSASGNG